MYPLLFGDPNQLLFGMYHMPEPGSSSEELGIVLCPPAWQEYPDSHRAMRTLAVQLARSGYHALRFDYYGTGDSAGEADAGDLERWTSDIATAVDELKAARGLKRVGVIGLRLGATLAARAAAARDDIEFAVLWQPIVDGATYLDSLRRLQKAWVSYESINIPNVERYASDAEVMGYPITEAMETGLRQIELPTLTSRPAARSLIIDEGESPRMEEVARRLEELGVDVRHSRLDGGRVWMRRFGGEQVQVPREILTSVTSWIAGDAQ